MKMWCMYVLFHACVVSFTVAYKSTVLQTCYVRCYYPLCTLPVYVSLTLTSCVIV
jgi:hypothetical protein